MKNQETKNTSSESIERKSDTRRRAGRLMAGVVLSLVIAATAAGCGNNNYEAVNKGIPGVTAKGADHTPDILSVSGLNYENLDFNNDDMNKVNVLKNGATVELCAVSDGKEVVLKDGADIRTSPIVGSVEDGTHTTIVTLGEKVTLGSVSAYYEYDGVDEFYGFKVADTQKNMPNVQLGVNNTVKTVWVDKDEVSFAEKAS